MSIWASSFDLEDNPPYAYQGSHVLPDHDDRRDSGEALQLAEVPSHITRDGRDDQPEDGTPWPWLRLSLYAEDAVLDRPAVESFHRAVGLWLERTGGTRPEWAPPPPGDTREQLPERLLSLVDAPAYTSTACETARECERAADGHAEHGVELRQAAERLHGRCRINNKFTGALCGCACHGEAR